VISDAEGNTFAGFAPVEKAHDSLKSFVFTLEKPHDSPARRFALKAEEKDRATK
jgi:hypothetical protein